MLQYLFAESLKGGLESVSEFSFGLFGGQIVAVVHVLVLLKIGRDFSHLRVELHVVVFFLAKHDGVLKSYHNKMTKYALIFQKERNIV